MSLSVCHKLRKRYSKHVLTGMEKKEQNTYTHLNIEMTEDNEQLSLCVFFHLAERESNMKETSQFTLETKAGLATVSENFLQIIDHASIVSYWEKESVHKMSNLLDESKIKKT